MFCALCFILLYYWISQEHRPSGTFKHTGAPVKTLGLSDGMFIAPGTCTLRAGLFSLHKLPYILSASELHFSCIESAVGLHSETFGLPRLAGLQSCRKPLRSYPTHLLDVECTCEGYFVVLPLKIESDKCNLLICFLGFLRTVWAAYCRKSIWRALRVKCWRFFLLMQKKCHESDVLMSDFSAWRLLHQDQYLPLELVYKTISITANIFSHSILIFLYLIWSPKKKKKK